MMPSRSQHSELREQVAMGIVPREFLESIERDGLTPNLDGLSEPFPVELDGLTVMCAWIPARYFGDEMTPAMVLQEVARRHLRSPTIELAHAAFDLCGDEEMQASPSAAIAGDNVARVGGPMRVYTLATRLDDSRERSLAPLHVQKRVKAIYRVLVFVSTS